MESYFAIIAVDNICSNGHIMSWAENVPSSIKELEAENYWLGETEFRAVELGLYLARLDIDDTDAEWSIVFTDDKFISGYEFELYLNQFVSELDAELLNT